jgi:hypothetical protein
MMYKPLTDVRGEELLQCHQSVALSASRNISAGRKRKQELMESEAECGVKWRASVLRKYDPTLVFVVLTNADFSGTWNKFSELGLRWGLMRDGECWEADGRWSEAVRRDRIWIVRKANGQHQEQAMHFRGTSAKLDTKKTFQEQPATYPLNQALRDLAGLAWPPQNPYVCRVVNGLADPVDRLKAIGKLASCPLCAGNRMGESCSELRLTRTNFWTR